MNISIVIPVYNGESTVEKLAEEIFNSFENSNYTFEIIFVHDCGPDNSLPLLLALETKHKDAIKVVKLTRNFGQHNAIIAGFEYCSGELIITMDEDLQHLPSDIIKLIIKQKEGDYDIVYGKYKSLEHSGFRSLTSVALKKILSWSIPDLDKEYSAFRIIKAEIAKETIAMRNSYTFLDGYLSWITKNTSHTLVQHQERYGGVSSYGVKTLIEHSINILITFSNLPIRILSYTAISTFIITFIYSLYIIFRKLMYNDLSSGYPTLIISIGMGVSLVLLGLGILGEYIYRINLKTTKRPNYCVKKSIDD